MFLDTPLPPLPLPADDTPLATMPEQPLNLYLRYIIPGETKAIQDEGPNRKKISNARRNIRIVAGFLANPVNEKARICLSVEIEGCQGSYERLVALGQFYYDHYIQHFLSAKCLIDTLQNNPGVENPALVRDGYRCMLTEKYDTDTFIRYPGKFPSGPDFWLNITCCAHIIPVSLGRFTLADDPQAKISLAKGFRSVLRRFGYSHEWIETKGGNCHRPSNLLTLSSNAQAIMYGLRLWFEKTDEPHTYDVKTHPPEFRKGFELPAQVTFKVREDLGIPGILPPEEGGMDLPDPDFLALHATCCKVVRLVGAIEFPVDSVFGDSESRHVLAQDGSSADVLFDELSRLVDPL
ncbi:uncharacterized protein BXZ73DRAFT_79032 [Epithele typhae]|uniref:uncharacterized protein n=1 Tax=Epithele typhae TaxID=378194 RepID=UPI0020085904|nr:uncharacterized protein BXZ73DRAFT_79032 [Epithele typhae]KAH9925368.1 hypothetical protein BXZ73DRAFT_79032 [Epithele typhae]